MDPGKLCTYLSNNGGFTSNSELYWAKVNGAVEGFALANYKVSLSGRHHDVFNAAMEGLYTEYGRDTVDGIINRIKKTEYKRHRMPLVIPRNKYENFN